MRSPLFAGLLSLFSLLFSSPSACARTWHILPDGTGDAPTIQAGIDSAVAGDTVSLGNGIYTGDGNRDIRFMGKAIVVRSASGIADSCVIDCEGMGRAFRFASGEGRGSVLRGVRITRGYATQQGGAIYCKADPSLVDCRFDHNRSELAGGAVYCERQPLFLRCVFERNVAPDGGAAYCKGGAATPLPEFAECEFRENRAADRGGAVYLWFSRSSFDFCRFVGNEADNRGGGAASEEWSNPTITECSFQENRATHGGAFVSYARGGASISRSSFSRNLAIDVGGAVVLNDWSTAAIDSCLFEGNEGARGGAIAFFNGTDPDFRACTIAENRAVSGGCVYVAGGTAPTIDRTILFGSTEGAAAFCEPNGSLALACCDVFGNAGGDWVGCIADQFGVDGNFSADPLFCDAENGDFTLDAASPCLNAPGCGQVGAFGEGCVLTAVAESGSLPAHAFGLFVSPNPANGRAVLRYSLHENTSSTIEVFDLAGRLVRALAARGAEGTILWDGKDGAGRDVAAGVYFVRAADRDPAETKRVILIR
jgi:hypothetical protein